MQTSCEKEGFNNAKIDGKINYESVRMGLTANCGLFGCRCSRGESRLGIGGYSD